MYGLCKYLQGNDQYALIILNVDLQDYPQKELLQMCSKCTKLLITAAMFLCADGGANRLYDVLKKKDLHKELIPDMICGDMDSIRPEIRDFYKSKCMMVESKCQETTDLEKCLRAIDSEYAVLVLGSLFGRMDHFLGCLHSIYKPNRQILLLDAQNVAFWLYPVP